MANIKAFEDFESIVSQANEDGKKILSKSVAPIAKKILKEHIVEDIYNAYTPIKGGWVNGTTYKRRRRLMHRVTAGFINDDILLITSTETANKPVVPGYSFDDRYEGAFLEMLGSGHTGIWRNGFARPAVENAQLDVETNPDIEAAIQNGIRTYMGEFDIVL